MEDEMKDFLETPIVKNDNILDGVDSVQEEKVAEVKDDETKGEKEVSVPPTDKETHTIPINALLDEREKRQSAQRELEEARKKLEQYEKSKSVETTSMSTEQLIETRVLDTKIQLSRFHAEKDFGKETVEAAIAWFDQNPEASWKFANSASPMHDAVEYYKKAKLVEDIAKDPEAYIEAQVAERLKKVQPTQTKETQSTKQTVPPSVASKANAAKGTEQKLGGFDSLFNK